MLNFPTTRSFYPPPDFHPCTSPSLLPLVSMPALSTILVTLAPVQGPLPTKHRNKIQCFPSQVTAGTATYWWYHQSKDNRYCREMQHALYNAQPPERDEVLRFPQPGDGGYCQIMVVASTQRKTMGIAGTVSACCTLHRCMEVTNYQGFPSQVTAGTATKWSCHRRKNRQWVLQGHTAHPVQCTAK